MNTWVVFRGATPAGDIKGLEGKSATRWLGDSAPRGVMSPMVTQPNEATARSPTSTLLPNECVLPSHEGDVSRETWGPYFVPSLGCYEGGLRHTNLPHGKGKGLVLTLPSTIR